MFFHSLNSRCVFNFLLHNNVLLFIIVFSTFPCRAMSPTVWVPNWKTFWPPLRWPLRWIARWSFKRRPRTTGFGRATLATSARTCAFSSRSRLAPSTTGRAIGRSTCRCCAPRRTKRPRAWWSIGTRAGRPLRAAPSVATTSWTRCPPPLCRARRRATTSRWTRASRAWARACGFRRSCCTLSFDPTASCARKSTKRRKNCNGSSAKRKSDSTYGEVSSTPTVVGPGATRLQSLLCAGDKVKTFWKEASAHHFDAYCRLVDERLQHSSSAIYVASDEAAILSEAQNSSCREWQPTLLFTNQSREEMGSTFAAVILKKPIDRSKGATQRKPKNFFFFWTKFAKKKIL